MVGMVAASTMIRKVGRKGKTGEKVRLSQMELQLMARCLMKREKKLCNTFVQEETNLDCKRTPM